MNVSIGDRWESFVDELVKSGRCRSVSEVMRDGLRLVEEREAQLKALHRCSMPPLPKGTNKARSVKAALNTKLAETSDKMKHDPEATDFLLF